MKNLILSLVSPISKLISLFSIPEPDMDDSELKELKSLIQDGDCLLSKKNWELSNLLMPGEWKHCAIYFKGLVYEATTKGVHVVSLEEFFFKKDSIGLCRYKPVKYEDVKQFLDSKIGSSYNWGFSMNPTDKFYCSELVYLVYKFVYPNFKAFFLTSNYLGLIVVRPTDMWNNLSRIKRWD